MKSPAGRPRDEQLTERILASTLQLLVERGYDELTIEGIARAAEVSRSTIYKRWPLLADLALDATLLARQQAPQYAGGDLVVPDTGSLRSDLVALTGEGTRVLDALDAAGILRGLIADSIRHPHVGERLQAEILGPDEERYAEIFRRAVARGEIRDDLDVSLLVPRLLSSFGIFRRVTVQQTPTQDTFELIVDVFLRGILRDP